MSAPHIILHLQSIPIPRLMLKQPPMRTERVHGHITNFNRLTRIRSHNLMQSSGLWSYILLRKATIIFTITEYNTQPLSLCLIKSRVQRHWCIPVIPPSYCKTLEITVYVIKLFRRLISEMRTLCFICIMKAMMQMLVHGWSWTCIYFVAL